MHVSRQVEAGLLAGLRSSLQGSLRLVEQAQAGSAPAPGGAVAALAATMVALTEVGQWLLQQHAAPGGGSRLGTSKLVHSP